MGRTEWRGQRVCTSVWEEDPKFACSGKLSNIIIILPIRKQSEAQFCRARNAARGIGRRKKQMRKIKFKPPKKTKLLLLLLFFGRWDQTRPERKKLTKGGNLGVEQYCYTQFYLSTLTLVSCFLYIVLCLYTHSTKNTNLFKIIVTFNRFNTLINAKLLWLSHCTFFKCLACFLWSSFCFFDVVKSNGKCFKKLILISTQFINTNWWTFNRFQNKLYS